jgi:ABC-type transporter Mla subunit MlaD
VHAVASGGFEVTFSKLDEAAGAYQAQGDAVRRALAQFESAASLADSAFGNLPQSKQLASQYEQFLSQVTRDVTKLSETLLAGAAKLAASSANYRAAERANMVG